MANADQEHQGSQVITNLCRLRISASSSLIKIGFATSTSSSWLHSKSGEFQHIMLYHIPGGHLLEPRSARTITDLTATEPSQWWWFEMDNPHVHKSSWLQETYSNASAFWNQTTTSGSMLFVSINAIMSKRKSKSRWWVPSIPMLDKSFFGLALKN